MSRVLAFAEKEIRDLSRNRQVFWLYLLLPLILTLVSVGMVVGITLSVEVGAASSRQFIDSVRPAIDLDPRLKSLPLSLAVASLLIRQVSILFLLVPVALTTISGAYSMVGEKQQKTIEPLLAAPITDFELFLGKTAALFAPAIATTWLAGLVATAALGVFTRSHFGYSLVPDAAWLTILFLVTPLVAVLGILACLAISARATDPQSAQQVAAFVILPVILFFVVVVARGILVSVPLILIFGCVIAAIDLVAFRLVVRRFRREEILTRWR